MRSRFVRSTILSLMCMIILLSSAYAEAVPSKAFFDNARQALISLSENDTDQALKLLNFSFSDSNNTTDSFLQFIEDTFSLEHIQTQVSVCYYDEISSSWKLAIPVEEPVEDSVKILVLTSSDMVTYSGYEAALWGDIQKATAKTDWVWWNKEYTSNGASLFAD